MSFVSFSIRLMLTCILNIDFSSSLYDQLFEENSYIDFYYQPNDVFVAKKQPLILNCAIGRLSLSSEKLLNISVPSANITWLKNNKIFSLADNKTAIFKNGSLHISSIDKFDGGIYACIVNYHSKVFLSRKGNVTVAVFNEIFNQVSSTSKQIGSYIRFNCTFERSTPELITWYKNNANIGNSNYCEKGENIITSKQNYTGSTLSDMRACYNIAQAVNHSAVVLPNGALEIGKASLEDAGEYYCATNFQKSNKFNLTIIPARIFQEEKRFAVQPSDTFVIAGKTAFFECAITGYPSASVQWLSNMTKIDFSRNRNRLRLFGRSSLLIENTTVHDQGEYSCLVEDGDSSFIFTAKLTVLIAPHFVKESNHLYELYVGCEVVIPCSISGIPRPVVTGFKDGKALATTNFSEVKDGILYQNTVNIKDAGIYQCFGINEAGSTQATFNLVILNQDNVTSIDVEVNNQLYLEELTTMFARLSWKRLSVFSPTKYKVYIHDKDDNRDMNFETSLTEFTVNDLSSGHSIMVTVVPFTDLCKGASSKELTFVVPTTEKTTVAVQNFAADPLGPAEIYVSWVPPLGNHNNVYVYKLLIEEINNGNVYFKEVEQEETTYSFDNLKKYTLYGVKVAVINEDGTVGPFSSQINVRTASDVPDLPPTNISVVPQSNGMAVVRWSSPSADSINGELSGYRIRYRDIYTKESFSVTVDADETKFRLTGLRKNTDYSLKIQVYNNVDFGPFSKKMYFKTPKREKLEAQPPGKPHVVQPQVYSNEIVVIWFPPEGGIYVREYIIEWGKTTPDEQAVKVDNKQLSYRITDLEPSTQYFISVRARNQAGLGANSLRVAETKEAEDFPEELYPPVGVHIDVLTHTTLNVTWHDSEKRKNFRLYLVRYKTNVPGEPRVRFINATDTNCLIHSLRPHTLYEVAVRIIYGSRKSTWSMTAAAITRESKPSSAPTDLTVMPMEAEPTSVQLNWQPPEEPNGELTGYLIFYTANPKHDISKWIIEPVVGDRLSTVINGLTSDTLYYFKALAGNRQGVGPYSTVAQYRTDSRLFKEEAAAAAPSMPTWFWYLIIGVFCLLVISAVAIATLVVCRSRGTAKSQSKAKKHGKETNHLMPNDIDRARRANSSLVMPTDSWACGGTTSINSASLRLISPNENLEAHSRMSLDRIYVGDMAPVMVDYRCINPSSPERVPLNRMSELDAAYFRGYPFPYHHPGMNEVMRSPLSTDSRRVYPEKEQYDSAVPLAPLQFPPYESSRYDVSSRCMPDPGQPVQDNTGDSAYGSDHPPFHPVDDPSSACIGQRLQSSSNGQNHRYYEDETRLKSDRTLSASSSDSARYIQPMSLDEEDAKLANVEEFVRDMKASSVDELQKCQEVES